MLCPIYAINMVIILMNVTFNKNKNKIYICMTNALFIAADKDVIKSLHAQSKILS